MLQHRETSENVAAFSRGEVLGDTGCLPFPCEVEGIASFSVALMTRVMNARHEQVEITESSDSPSRANRYIKNSNITNI